MANHRKYDSALVIIGKIILAVAIALWLILTVDVSTAPETSSENVMPQNDLRNNISENLNNSHEVSAPNISTKKRTGLNS